jgi:coenzyme F420-reducing hydrogenase gamma subunit
VKPKVAVFKFASCDGCQLQLLNLEDELLAIAGIVDFAFFAEARSRMVPGPYDVAFVEGSITTEADARRIQQIRADSRVLVTIGACATAGGIQALRNWADVEEYKRAVYPSPELISSLATSTPIATHVRVDHEISGCPIDKRELLAALRSLLSRTRPSLPGYSVCLECKRRGNVCVVVARGEPSGARARLLRLLRAVRRSERSAARGSPRAPGTPRRRAAAPPPRHQRVCAGVPPCDRKDARRGRFKRWRRLKPSRSIC